VPLLAGPGAISTTILAAQSGGAAHIAWLIACIAAVCAMLWLTLLAAERIGAKMGRTGLNIATRLLGLLLAAIAIEMMAGGLKALLPGLS
jgi:multiple antibiotic resistance protein